MAAETSSPSKPAVAGLSDILYTPPSSSKLPEDWLARIGAAAANPRAVIVQSTLANADPVVQSENIVRAFNSHVKDSAVGPAGARMGFRLDPGHFVLAQRNKVPE